MALRRSLRKYATNSAESLASVGLRFEVSSFGPRMFPIHRKPGKAVRAIATHIGDIFGCGEPELVLVAPGFSGKRFGELEGQEGPFVHVGVEWAQRMDFSGTLT